jgi:MoaA/NifB/PqqE/SkfB family radical SAM enzyme
MNNTICPAPWVAMAIRPDGVVIPCCSFLPSNKFKENSTVNHTFLHNRIWENIRTDMQEGIAVDGCINCYQTEQHGGISDRQVLLDWFGQPDKIELTFLELAFDNICNLACVGCEASFSSKWASEDLKFNRTVDIKALVTHKLNFGNIDLSKLTVLKLVGGEPLANQTKMISVLEKTNLSNLTLTITTNGTILVNERLRRLIERCKTVHFYISIDGSSSVNEWCRWPTQHRQVETNIEVYRQWWKDYDNIILMSHTVINAYNIWDLGTFIDTTKEKFPGWRFNFDWVTIPQWQDISGISDEYKEELITQLLAWNSTIKESDINGNNPFLISIERINSKTVSNWDQFIQESMKLASERKLDLIAMVPSLKGKTLKYG